MIELIAIIIFFISLIGMGIILFQKMPLFLELPEAPPARFNLREFLIKLKAFSPFENFSSESFFQKILSKTRVLTLKIDKKTSGWLQKLREKAQKKKLKEEDDNYWQEVKKFKKE